IILTLATYLFFSGHDAPGGGFIGGLVLASAFVLILLAFDIETLKEELPVDFKKVGATGVFIVLASGVSSVFFGEPFLNQVFWSLLFLFSVLLSGLPLQYLKLALL